MTGWRMRVLGWRMRQRPTTCQWRSCGNPLPKVAVDGRYCSEECAYEAWEFGLI